MGMQPASGAADPISPSRVRSDERTGIHGIMAGTQSRGKCLAQMGFPVMEFATKKKRMRREPCLEQIEAARLARCCWD